MSDIMDGTMAQQPGTLEVIVTVDEASRSRIGEVAARLQAEGLGEIQSLESLGMITGKVHHDGMDRLRKLAGVVSVEPAGEVHQAPPESGIQ